MDKIYIAVFAGKYLERYNKISNIGLQSYIRIQPEIEKSIAIEDIDEVLNLLVDAGFIEQVDALGDGMATYKRFIPKQRHH